jgi:hypothetical protein
LTIFIVLVLGTVCLYLLLRRVIGVTFIGALLTAFFASSRNVINPHLDLVADGLGLSDYADRAGCRAPPGAPHGAGAARSPAYGSARHAPVHAGVLHGSVCIAVCGHRSPGLAARHARAIAGEAGGSVLGRRTRTGIGIAAAIAALAAIWTIAVYLWGGGVVDVAGIHFASRDWRRPAILTAAALAVVAYARGWSIRRTQRMANPSIVAFAAGAAAGAAVFLWIYLPTYAAHNAFLEEQLMSSLTPHDPTRWPTWDVVWALGAYESLRVFRLALVAAILACVPALVRDSRIRAAAVWVVGVTLLVLVAPVRFGDFSIWKTLVSPLPGFSAIRDPGVSSRLRAGIAC